MPVVHKKLHPLNKQMYLLELGQSPYCPNIKHTYIYLHWHTLNTYNTATSIGCTLQNTTLCIQRRSLFSVTNTLWENVTQTHIPFSIFWSVTQWHKHSCAPLVVHWAISPTPIKHFFCGGLHWMKKKTYFCVMNCNSSGLTLNIRAHTHSETHTVFVLQWKIFTTTAAGCLAALWRQTEFPSHSCMCVCVCVC